METVVSGRLEVLGASKSVGTAIRGKSETLRDGRRTCLVSQRVTTQSCPDCTCKCPFSPVVGEGTSGLL